MEEAVKDLKRAEELGGSREVQDRTRALRETIEASNDPGLSSEETAQIRQQIEQEFEDLTDYMDKHYHQDIITISPFSQDGLELRNEFAKLVEEKGRKEENMPTEHGKMIVLRGEEIENLFGAPEITIWHPGEKFPIHINVSGLEEGEKPHYVSINSNGEVWTSVNWYDDSPETIEAANLAKKIPPEKWQEFVELVLEKAREYTPEEKGA